MHSKIWKTGLLSLICGAALLGAGEAYAHKGDDDHRHGHGRGHYKHRDWHDHDYHHEHRHSSYRRPPRVHVEYSYGGDACEIERRWFRGAYRERVVCHDSPWRTGYLARPSVQYVPVPVSVVQSAPPLPSGPEYIGNAYYDSSQRYCREYQTQAMVGGRLQEVYGQACLQPDGAWAFNQ